SPGVTPASTWPTSTSRMRSRRSFDRASLIGSETLVDGRTHRPDPWESEAALLRWAIPDNEAKQFPARAVRGAITMGLSMGDPAPDFEADTTEGGIKFHDWIGDSWAVLFSHPKDFTPICTTELGYMAKLKPEFDRRGVKIIGLSVDATTDHEKWLDDI